jgi:hypothetical protein
MWIKHKTKKFQEEQYFFTLLKAITRCSETGSLNNDSDDKK